jgi:inner membrane protease subunit 1
MERFLRSALTISPWALGRLAYKGAGVFCACTLVWEHLVTIQSSEGPSMYPTFNTRGDWLLISRRNANGRDIQVGDIVRYNHPHILGAHAAKRVIGLPGDFVCRDPPYSAGAGMQPDMIQV